MASYQQILIIGNVGRDPETRTFPSGDKVANVSVATTEKWKDKTTGEMKEATEWHRLVFNGRLADIVAEYVKKGSSIMVRGSLRTRKWTDKDGAEKQTTEVRVDELKMLGGRPEGAAPAQRQAPAPAPRQSGGGGFSDMDDDIPFAPFQRGPFF